LFKKVLIIILFLLNIISNAQDSFQIKKLDSIELFNEKIRDNDLTLVERLPYANKVSELAYELGVDSLILRSNRTLSAIHLRLYNYELYKKINFENLKLSNKIKDTLAIARANHNLGYYYDNKVQYDSAYFYYYNAVSLYGSIDNIQNQVEVLLNMAIIQEDQKDYIGAEENATESIKLLLTLPKTENNLDTSWSLYNLLGIISTRLELYDEAIDFHNKALLSVKKISDDFFYILNL